jgi:acyl carrier protein
MTDTRERVAKCFHIVFPDLPVPVERATQANVPQWDSVAAITLINVLEEEFGTPIDFEVAADLNTFDDVAAYIQSARQNS